MWYLIKVITFIVASLFVQNIVKDRNFSNLLLSHQFEADQIVSLISGEFSNQNVSSDVPMKSFSNTTIIKVFMKLSPSRDTNVTSNITNMLQTNYRHIFTKLNLIDQCKSIMTASKPINCSIYDNLALKNPSKSVVDISTKEVVSHNNHSLVLYVGAVKTTIVHEYLRKYLPSQIYEELWKEYVQMTKEYDQRSKDDSNKSKWKEFINTYIRYIKLLTNQINSLLLKLSREALSNVVTHHQLDLTYVIYLLSYLTSNIAESSEKFYYLINSTWHFIGLTSHDIFYLLFFVITIYRMNKFHKHQLSQLTSYYDNKLDSLELSMQRSTREQQERMNVKMSTLEKERKRCRKLMQEQTKKLDKLLHKINARPLLPPPPPPYVFNRYCAHPPCSIPSFQFQQSGPTKIAPMEPPKPTVTPKLTPTDQQVKVDSRQFFGCPDNYTAPKLRR